MKDLILHIYDWLSAHRRMAAAMLLAIIALSLVSALRLDFQEDISAFLPGEAPPEKGQGQMAVFFEGGTLENCVVTDNAVMGAIRTRGGGGYCDGKTSKIIGCFFVVIRR